MFASVLRLEQQKVVLENKRRSLYDSSVYDDQLEGEVQRVEDELFQLETKLIKLIPVKEEPIAVSTVNTNTNQMESIEEIKQRLMNTDTPQLDELVSVENQNRYHDSIQQELIDSLPNMVNTIKTQALQFQQLIKEDATYVKEVAETFNESHNKFDNVSERLSKYHKEG
ncbi:hypothetical protein DAMA08_021350 [Martiniozyma asiatica (nom. inval.)]|nr:hypothetical protein DAMA08_021350 [Martiniozyma asiatica]